VKARAGLTCTQGTWDQWALDTGLSPGAPVNNCRWASIPLVEQQATSNKQQAASCGKKEFDMYRSFLYKVNAADGFVY